MPLPKLPGADEALPASELTTDFHVACLDAFASAGAAVAALAGAPAVAAGWAGAAAGAVAGEADGGLC